MYRQIPYRPMHWCFFSRVNHSLDGGGGTTCYTLISPQDYQHCRTNQSWNHHRSYGYHLKRWTNNLPPVWNNKFRIKVKWNQKCLATNTFSLTVWSLICLSQWHVPQLLCKISTCTISKQNWIGLSFKVLVVRIGPGIFRFPVWCSSDQCSWLEIEVTLYIETECSVRETRRGEVEIRERRSVVGREGGMERRRDRTWWQREREGWIENARWRYKERGGGTTRDSGER